MTHWSCVIEKLQFIYYQEGEMWVGWLEEYPDYHTQGVSFDELKDNLRDIYQDLNAGNIPYARRHGELVIG